MENKQWVQHISGMGEKWSVRDAGTDDQRWQTSYQSGRLTMFLPKSEYRLCDPPEMWKDVTEACTVEGATIRHATVCGRNVNVGTAEWVGQGVYRLRKVPVTDRYSDRKWAFIVEQKVPQ